MALATQCPHCGTMFRVASDQLKLRGGIVRCGACQEIFDGSATLVDLDKVPAKPPAAPPQPAPTPEITPAETAPLPEPASSGDELPFTIVDAGDGAGEPAEAPALPEKTDFEDQPVYTLDFDHTFDPLGILPKVASPDDAGDAGNLGAQAATAADEDIDPLSLLQPWSRPPKETVDALQPAPETAVADTPAAAPSGEDAAIPPDPLTPAPEQAAPPAHTAVAPDGGGRREPVFDLPVDEELVATALPGHEPESTPGAAAAAVAGPAPQPRPRAADAPPLLTRESAASTYSHAAAPFPPVPPAARTPAAKRAEKAAARRSKLTPTRIEPQPKLRVAEIDEPEFVRRSRHQEQSGRTRRIAMLAGSAVLLLVLVAQGVATFRNALAARFPAAKPALVSSCALLGCRVELPAQVDSLAIETGELTTLGGGAYSFTTELRNGSATAQAWPSLELTLIDTNDKPLVRRVFAPRDYLAPGTPVANGMAPAATQAIKLHFRVDDLQPSGYHIAVFYP
ncbi:MAG: zinc-ribbon and DUF3426 domain-containing protein [Pseudomonadota bacterium]